MLNHRALWLLPWLLFDLASWRNSGPLIPDSGCSCELGAWCHPPGQMWEMPNGLAVFIVAFASSLNHMVLKCQTVPECGPQLRQLDRENTLQIQDLFWLFILPALGLLLYYFNHHLWSNAMLRVVFLVVRDTKKKRIRCFLMARIIFPGPTHLVCNELSVEEGEMSGQFTNRI